MDAEAVMEGEKSEWLSQIHLAASDGSGSFQLTSGDKSATAPQWSPDGQSIAFLSMHLSAVIEAARQQRVRPEIQVRELSGLGWR